MTRRIDTMSLSALCCSLAVLVSGCVSTTQAENAATPVRAERVAAVAGERGFRYSAQIVPVEQVSLSFKTSGYVLDLLQVKDDAGRLHDVEKGDVVTAGALLARVEERDYRAKVSRAEAAVAQAGAQEEKSLGDLNRAEALFAADALPRPELDAARAAHRSAAAATAAARADLDVASSSLVDTALRAPRNGVVLERHIDRGALASPGSVVFVLGAVDSLKAVFGVPDGIVRQLRLGMLLTATADTVADRAFTGRVTTIAPSADRDTHLFGVEVTIPNGDRALRPGMIATIQLENPRDGAALHTAPAVPLTAVVKDNSRDGAYAVFVVTGEPANLQARLRPITPGAIAGDGIQITRGLTPGEQVIVSGAARLRDGERITVIP